MSKKGNNKITKRIPATILVAGLCITNAASPVVYSADSVSIEASADRQDTSSDISGKACFDPLLIQYIPNQCGSRTLTITSADRDHLLRNPLARPIQFAVNRNISISQPIQNLRIPGDPRT